MDSWCWPCECYDLIFQSPFHCIHSAIRFWASCFEEEVWVFFFFFFFPLKECKDHLPLMVGFLDVSWVWNWFLRCWTQDISWEQLSLMEPQALWIEVLVCKGDKVVVTENVYFFMPTFGSWGKEEPEGKLASWAVKVWNWTEQTGKGLSHTTFSP